MIIDRTNGRFDVYGDMSGPVTMAYVDGPEAEPMKPITKAQIYRFFKDMDAIQLSGLIALAQAEIKKRFGK